MLELIINADDLGLTPGCNKGIVRTLTEGIVSDTTLLVNTAYSQEAVELLRASGINQCGLHLNLTYGTPVLPIDKVPSLVDDSGRFRRKVDEAVATMKLKEAAAEMQAQVDRFKQTGLKLTHLDSHHHVHTYPDVIDVVIELAKVLAVPLRQQKAVKGLIRAEGVVTTDWFFTDFYGPNATKENLQRLILSRQDGVLEIMSHPAQAEPLLFEISSYNNCREKELEILTDQDMKTFLRDNGVRLISFADL